MPSHLPVVAAGVVDQDRVRDHRSGRHSVVALEDRLDAPGRKHFEGRSLRGHGKGVRVLSHEQRPVDSVHFAGSRRWPG